MHHQHRRLVARVLSVWAITVGSMCLLAPSAGAQPGSATPTLLVDDDGMQCPGAAFTSIQAAVDDAASGSMIRICPGRYAESVTVDKTLRLLGVPEQNEGVDCFASTLPGLPTDTFVIVGPADASATAIMLAADDVELAGLVVTGVGRAVTTAEQFSGYRIRHNIFANNFLGVGLGGGANGESQRQTRVDHNCIRNNVQGVRNTYLDHSHVLLHARIDHNSTTGSSNRAYEVNEAAMDVTFDHNVSRLDGFYIQFTNSRDGRVLDNSVFRSPRGVNFVGASDNIEISRNVFIQVQQPPSAAIATNPDPTGRRNTHVLIRENTITDYGRGIAIAGPPAVPVGTLADSEIVGNLITGTRLEAINLNALNTGITIRENTLDYNTVGIHAHCTEPGPTQICAAGNTITANEMIGNVEFDAIDDSGLYGPTQNTWIDNRCATDRPEGQLCALD